MAKSDMTRKQQQIFQVFNKGEAPMTPQEVWEQARDDQPGLGIATVYRAVKTFVDNGDLRRIDIDGEPTRYEITHKPHHHHFYCTNCNTIFEIKHCPPDLTSIVPDGFKMADHSIVLYGECRECVG